MALQFGVSYKGGDYEFVRARRWPFSIGRHPSNDLCLANSSLISRRHARILKVTDGYRLISSGRNPTFLNGEPVPRDRPVELVTGDCIEFPDYLIVIRDTAVSAPIGATKNVETVSNSAIIVRRLASLLSTTNWTVEAIHAWLGARRGREIWIRHRHVALCLPGAIPLEPLRQRLKQFDALIADLDPLALAIELVDPGQVPIRTEDRRGG